MQLCLFSGLIYLQLIWGRTRKSSAFLQLFLFVLTVVAAGCLSVDFEALKCHVEEGETVSGCKKEAAVQGFKSSHILPLVIWQKAQHIAGDKWDASSAARLIQDTSVKNTKHSRSGIVCEIHLLQKKGQHWRELRYSNSTTQGCIPGFTLSNSAELSDRGQLKGSFIKSRQADLKSLEKLEEFFKLTILF